MHWTELPPEELLRNREEHLEKLKAQLPTTTHPIDLENLQMSIGRTEAVIVCEKKLAKIRRCL